MKGMEYHFLGIAGVGISALAQICLEKGFQVEGSDRCANEYTEILQKKGAKIYKEAEALLGEKQKTVIYGSAIQKSHPHLIEARKKGYPTFHRAEFLASLMGGYDSILVAGTHGKTSVSSLLTWVFCQLNLDPTYVLGGKLKQKESNAKLGKGRYFIAEADESDGTFLKLPCKAAIITNLEEDHLEFWGSYEKLEEAFSRFFLKANPKYTVFGYHPNLVKLAPFGFSLGYDEKAHFFIHNFSEKEGRLCLDISFEKRLFSSIEAPLMGKHNGENVAFVFALCFLLGLPEDKVKEAIKTFPGVSRRLEHKVDTQYITLFDDYAHHPTEIKATLSAVKKAYYPRRVVAIFEPHRYTRFQALEEDFFLSLQEADYTLITDLFSAGQKKPKGWNLAKKVQEKGFTYLAKKDLTKKLASYLEPYDVVVLLNAGELSSFSGSFIKEVFPKIRPWKVGVCFGGKSKEHEISCNTASFFLENVQKLGFSTQSFFVSKEGKWSPNATFSPKILQELLSCDIVIPAFHGPYGEDGMMQGFLETLGLPYVGASYKGSSLCMHKGWIKSVVEKEGIFTAKYVSFSKVSWEEKKDVFLDKIEKELLFPLWVKGAHLGSSLGVFPVKSLSEVKEAIETVFTMDDALVVEEHFEGKIVEFAVMGLEKTEVSLGGEVLHGGEFYSYEKKYGKEPMLTKVPARIPHEWMEKGRELAKKIYEIANLKGLARIDFFVDDWGKFCFLEVNPFPGFTSISLFPLLWKERGFTSEELIKRLLLFAKKKQKSRI